LPGTTLGTLATCKRRKERTGRFTEETTLGGEGGRREEEMGERGRGDEVEEGKGEGREG